MYPHCEYTLLWSIQPLPLLFFALLPPTPPPFNSFQHIISSTFTDTVFYDIVNALPFSFPFPPSPSSIEWFHCYKHVLHLSLYMIMLVFCVYVYLWIYCPCMKENMQPLSFWVWLTSLNMMSSNCISLPSNHHIIIPYDWVKLHCVFWLMFLWLYGSYGWSCEERGRLRNNISSSYLESCLILAVGQMSMPPTSALGPQVSQSPALAP
jgi:hypothetical protein